MNNETTISVRAVLFDLDGTLLDTLPDLHAAVCSTLKELGRPELSIEATSHYVGRGMAMLIKRALAGSLDVDENNTPAFEEALACFSRHYEQENGRQARFFPGVLEGLEILRAKGVPMAVVTNKPKMFTLSLLETTGLMSYFTVVLGGEDLPEKKPNPMPLIWACGRLNVLPAESLFIGDSIIDSQAARAAGCRVFLLPYGYNEGRDIQELDCDGIISSIVSGVEHISYPC